MLFVQLFLWSLTLWAQINPTYKIKFICPHFYLLEVVDGLPLTRYKINPQFVSGRGMGAEGIKCGLRQPGCRNVNKSYTNCHGLSSVTFLRLDADTVPDV